MVEEMEAELRERWRHEVSSERVGEMALMRLQGMDMVSYVRFASVFRRYTDVEQFSSEASRLKERSTSRSRGSGVNMVYQKKFAESA
jgi:transcriptional repressor NrdR